MENADLTPAMQEMMAEMATMRAELNSLKKRAQALPEPEQAPAIPAITSTRRTTLKRLGLALLGGAAAATALGQSPVQAKVIANPQTNGLANHVGMLVLPPGATAPTGTAPAYNFGLVAFGETTAFDLSKLPGGGNSGVYGNSSKNGVYGEGGINGVYGYCSNNNGSGVVGNATGATFSTGVSGTGNTYGVTGSGPIGVYGSGTPGVVGTTGVNGSGSTGVVGTGSGNSSTGVSGSTGVAVTSGTAVSGVALGPSSNGIFGQGTQYAGVFAGNVQVTGTINKSAVGFKIDHPLDPANKYLYHTGIESPDMMNIYNGIVTLNGQGEATVEMPDWFEALNSDYRYQLTSIGAASPNLHLAGKLANFKFKIGGGLPGQEVSWMVTGIRQDAYAKAHRMPVEEDKNEKEKGLYLHPELFGQSEEKSMHSRPEATK
jgi:hypothetical protein